jgi:hypothetical protein
MKTALHKRHFTLLFLALALIPVSGYVVLAITETASRAYVIWGIDERNLPTVVRFCLKLGATGLSILGACLISLVAMLHLCENKRATAVSTIVLLAWLAFCVVAFAWALSCLLTTPALH